jgi:hypothetical protein
MSKVVPGGTPPSFMFNFVDNDGILDFVKREGFF